MRPILIQIALCTDVCGISGYTEWISSTTPAISIGWDWRLDVTQGRPRYVLEGFPRSNLMFQDAERRDLGPIRTATVLKAALDTLSWQEGNHKGYQCSIRPNKLTSLIVEADLRMH